MTAFDLSLPTTNTFLTALQIHMRTSSLDSSSSGVIHSHSSGHSHSSEEEEEEEEEYCKGGYHPVHLGDFYGFTTSHTSSSGGGGHMGTTHGASGTTQGTKTSIMRYQVIRKLGWGHFSTVWLARDALLNRPWYAMPLYLSLYVSILTISMSICL